MTKTMTDTVYALESQHYSRQRLMAVSRFYYPTFKKQMLFYFLLSVVLGLLGFYSSGHRTFTTMILGLLGTAQSFLLYWAPAVMIRENRETEVALPALWSEKFTVILVYFLVVIPVILYVPEMLIKSTLSGGRRDLESGCVWNIVESHTNYCVDICGLRMCASHLRKNCAVGYRRHDSRGTADRLRHRRLVVLLRLCAADHG